MADPNALYSYQGGEPQPLPHEIFYQEGWGATNFRQGVETFTNEELAKAGYTGPYTKPEFDADVEIQAWSSEEQNWITTSIPDEVFWNRLRNKRNFLLSSTDWVVIKAKEEGTTLSTAWKTYRKDLRDLPANTTDPKNVTWPTQPE